MADDLAISLENLRISEGIIEDEHFRTQFASRLQHISFDVSNDNPKKIWEVLVRVVNIVSASSNVDWPINIIQLLDKLEITSEKVFEYERFWTEFENGLKNVGFNVNNYDLKEIWRQLHEGVTDSVNEVENDDLKSKSRPFVEKLSRTQKWITENKNFRIEIVNKLKEVGFYPRNDIPEQICLWKVLRLAVHSSVCAGRNINLANENIQDTKLRLEQLLLAERTPNSNIGNSLDDVLYRPLTQELASQLTSPQDIANRNLLGIKRDTHVDFVTNLIEKQFLIKWNTNVSGEPGEFNFYEFCDVEKLKENEEQNPRDVPMEVKTKHLQYEPRSAHVKVQLYRYCRTRTRPRIEYTKNQLCPPVYIRTVDGWKKWVPQENNNFRRGNPVNVTPVNDTEFDWMDGIIKNYIVSSAIEIEANQLKETPTLYWAVVEDTDFKTGAHLQLNEIGKTQVYVGISKNGINGRWLNDGTSHCRTMKRCLDNVQEMTTYDPSRLEENLLVDARLLLAKLRGTENCALFVMKTYKKTKKDEEQMKKGEEQMKTGEEQMKTDEKLHINGISSEDRPILAAYPDWKPMHMAYGMNAQ